MTLLTIMILSQNELKMMNPALNQNNRNQTTRKQARATQIKAKPKATLIRHTKSHKSQAELRKRAER